MSKGLMPLAQMTSALLVLEVASMPWNTHPCVITHIFNVPFATRWVSYTQGDKYFCLGSSPAELSYFPFFFFPFFVLLFSINI